MSSAPARARVFADTQRISSKTDTDKIEVLDFTCKVREDKERMPKDMRSIARVYNVDPLDVARECYTAGFNTAMLVEINENYPIPGMIKGGMQGQESEVLLRSNYARRMNDNQYPMKRRTMSYIPGLMIHKDKIYELYQKPFPVSMIGVTVVRRPTLHTRQENGNAIECYASRSEEDLMRDTINSAFHLAQSRGHDTIIVPALGCEQGHPVDAVIGFCNDAMTKFGIRYAFYAVKSYIDYKPHCHLFMKFHHGIEREYAPKTKMNRDTSGEQELLEDVSTGDDMAWLDELGESVSTELAAQANEKTKGSVKFAEPEATVKAIPKRKKKPSAKKAT